ncbi:MAG TPA: bifunctional demethylmenaquinone methyltransferase/2-methoxy-6-polyprenyl-1,4-benzoquinol methylase UbiE [Desulfobacterales bacterium]|nr:bifunctional demethylmenaquinone methyltransferase/2-methoxy-6-polyprenyl-1,4-benzoquinol methylase UbiE [Desulfobacterales bacterium]
MKNVELPFVKEMFDAIAPKYDLLNRLLSLRLDVCWRRVLVSEMKIPKYGQVMDVACGTGDVPLEMIRQKGWNISVFGVDFSPGMLTLAKSKIKNMIGGHRIHLLRADAFNLPFKEETFDAITIAFGIRNIIDKDTVLRTFHNLLKTGGILLVLELSVPNKGLLLSIYLFYFEKILPLIGWFLSKNLKAYQYLPSSVSKFPEADEFAAMMRSAGFTSVRWRKLTAGIATLYIGSKML